MEIREFLQIKLWSKRTTRKILVWLGIVFGVVVVGCVVVYEIEMHWLTAGERSAAKAAMAQIDALQDFGSLTDQEYEAKDKQAEAKVEAAKSAVVTQRDEQVAFSVMFYLDSTENDQLNVQTAQFFWQRHIPAGSAPTVLGKKLYLSGTELRTLTRLELRKILN